MTPQELNRFMLNRLLDASVMAVSSLNTAHLLISAVKKSSPTITDVKIQLEVRNDLEDALKQYESAKNFAELLMKDLTQLKKELL